MKFIRQCLKRCQINNQHGLSLIELLVATVIGLILLAGIYQVFVGSTTGYRYNEQLSRLQENGRFVLDLMTRDIRMAGYMGCGDQVIDVNTLDVTAASDAYMNNFAQAISGFEATSASAWHSALDASIDSPLGGSDIITVRGAGLNKPLGISQEKPPTSADMKFDSLDVDINPNDILLISDCSFQAIIQVTDTGNVTVPPFGTVLKANHNSGTVSGITPGNSTASLGHTFPAGSDVLRMQSASYYVRLDGTEPTLYRRLSNGTAAEPLIAGVENMQVLYGEDTGTDRNVDVYRTANNVADWDKVVAIRIGLLLRSPGEIGKKSLDTSTYVVNGTTIDPIGNGTAAAPVDDRRMRQVFVTTVGIRNRLP